MDIEYAVKFDKDSILDEQRKSHPDAADIYDLNTLTPDSAKVYIVEDVPAFLMITYTVQYKNENCLRLGCGHYHPIVKIDNSVLAAPHPFQGSICW